MLKNYRWKVTNKNPHPGVRSMQISDFYAFAEEASWNHIGKDGLISNKSSVGDRQNFSNEKLGLPHRVIHKNIVSDDLLKLRAGYPDNNFGGNRYKLGFIAEERRCPIDNPLIVTCFDKQDDCFKGITLAFNENKEAWLLDYANVLSFDDVQRYYKKKFTCPNGEQSEIWGGLVDAGDKTFEVYDFCILAQSQGLNIYPSKGYGGTGFKLYERRKTNANLDLYRYDYKDHDLKIWVYISKIKQRNGSRFYLPADISDHADLVSEITAEKLVDSKNRTGGEKQVFQKTKVNDYGDALKLCFLTFKILDDGL